MLRAFLRDITPREASGLVITMYRSTAMTISVIMLQMPKSAPQKAYNSQPVGGKAPAWKVVVHHQVCNSWKH